MRQSKLFAVYAAVVGVLMMCGHGARAEPRPGDAPGQPKDAQWTIFCATLRGPLHVEQSKNMKDWLMKNTSLREWYVIHGDQESTIYHGFYRSINDPKDKDSGRARSDRAVVDAVEGADGVRPFAQCMFVETNSPDPAAPAEWNLVNAKGAYTLEIAVYKDNPLRKEAAVESVKDARKRGVEAYYYHGATASSVCIGAWPVEAVSVTQQAGGGANRNGDETLMVLPFGVKGSVPQNLQDDQGNPVRVMAPKFVPNDPVLISTMRQYQEFSVNGTVVPRKVKRADGSEVVDVQRSQLMEIPKAQESMLTALPAPIATSSAGARVVGAPADLNDPPRPTKPKPTGQAGRLKSIGQ